MEDESKTVVLVADDEPSLLAMVSSHLRAKGYSVLEASDGDQAWELASEHLPHLVVLDVMMPGMSGWEVCRKIREAISLAHTGVVMLTGIGENLNEMTSPLYGADAYVDKPFEFDDLDEKIEDALARRRAGVVGRGERHDVEPRPSKPKRAREEKKPESLRRSTMPAGPSEPQALRGARKKPKSTGAAPEFSEEMPKPLVKARREAKPKTPAPEKRQLAPIPKNSAVLKLGKALRKKAGKVPVQPPTRTQPAPSVPKTSKPIGRAKTSKSIGKAKTSKSIGKAKTSKSKAPKTPKTIGKAKTSKSKALKASKSIGKAKASKSIGKAKASKSSKMPNAPKAIGKAKTSKSKALKASKSIGKAKASKSIGKAKASKSSKMPNASAAPLSRGKRTVKVPKKPIALKPEPVAKRKARR